MARLPRTAWLLAITLVSLTGVARAAEVSPLRALDRFIGTWDVEIKVKPGALVRAGATARGMTVNTWINNGQTLRQTWSVTSSEGKLLFNGQSDLTYDPTRRIYRNKTQLAQGAPSESEGTWNDQTKIFTWKSRDPKLMTTTTALSTPERDGIEHWIMDITDGAGRKIFDCQGKNTRRP